MKLWLRHLVLVLPLAAFTTFAFQAGHRGNQTDPQQSEPPRLPNGKDQQDEILKREHELNLKDAANLVAMAEQLKADIEKNDRYVLSLGTIKKADEIEKLVRKIRARLRRN